MITYRDAGVDIEAGDEVVRRIKPLVRDTFTPPVLTDIGAFGGFFQFSGEGYKDPVLVSSVDGVGTKLKVAFRMNRHDTVGQDLVNHCVNDIAVCGAKPLFFLDYFSTGKLASDTAVSVVSGFAKACKENGCALIGGETAEMPDIYSKGEYDLAGTIVGVVDKGQILSADGVKDGDLLIGLPSTGLHTNGYSLARKILFTYYSVHDTPDRLSGETIGEVLLRVHRSYLKNIQSLHQAGMLHAAAHITGGGIPGNVQRVIPGGLAFDVDYSAWKQPEIFRLIQDLGNVPESDMRATFNLGIGLVLVVSRLNESKAITMLKEQGESPLVIGQVSKVSN